MAYCRVHARSLAVLLSGLLVIGATTSCARHGDVAKETEVKRLFASCKTALMNNQVGQVTACLPRNVDDYLSRLKSGTKGASPSAAPSPPEGDSPTVDLLLRTALEKKVPDNLRPNLTLDRLLQRIADKKLLDPKDIQQIDLGRVYVSGDRASAELYYQGTLTALRLPFVLEGKDWKIDLMSVLPYAEVLMRLDRIVNRETENQQVELLVSQLPSL